MYEKIQSKKADFIDIAAWWDFCAKPAFKQFCMGVSSHLADIKNICFPTSMWF